MNTFDNIPEEMKMLNQWVCIEAHSKIPMRAWEPVPASSTNPQSWAAFSQARESVEIGNYANLGFVFNDNGLIGIDIDDGYDEDGLLSDLAGDIIAHCQSYTERSRSGRGFHIIVKGEIPFKGKNNLAGVEIYKTGRYFITTGDTLLFKDVISNQQALDYILSTYFPDIEREESSNVGSGRIYSPIWDPYTGGKIKLHPTYPNLPSGCRNLCLTSLAGMLHTAGYSIKAILSELQFCNRTACKPQVSKWEIQQIVQSVTKYKR